MTDEKPFSVEEDARWHHLEVSEVTRLLQSDLRHGLSAAEAHARLRRYGPNAVTRRSGRPAWMRFLLQFNQPLVCILVVAGGITAGLAEWVDSGVIFGVVLGNALVGFIQESRAGKAIEALNRLVTTEAMVRRDGGKLRVPSCELVPGDVVLLQAGDRVPADLRLFDVRNLQCDESSLTGESLPVVKITDSLEKDIVLADRRNQAYAGTLVTAGQAEGLVWATGDHTETGRIAWLISEAVDISTPLTRKIARFGKRLLWIILGLAALTFSVGMARGEAAVEMFMAAVALAVGAIPEGLPAAVTIVLASGASRMAAQRAIIRKLPAVETLGSTTVICTDKTGTLTENQMTVTAVYAGGRTYEISGKGYKPDGGIRFGGHTVDPAEHPALIECLRAGLLCNDARIVMEKGRYLVRGDPTEAALLVSAAKAGLAHADAAEALPIIDMIPFASEHMFRATLHGGDGKARVIYKVGAAERLLERCDKALDEEGREIPLDRDAARGAVHEMGTQGLRILALARLNATPAQDALEHEHVESGLTFLGLQGMLDPPRDEAIKAVANCRRAGIAVKMITGDHAITAKAIARHVGLADGDERIKVLEGCELESVAEEDLPRVAAETTVFARVSPEQKLRLVQALQSLGHVVAMTGDGVNDAPALKQADIGVAMGVTGTDVAKGAADMVLTDDNFATIEAAVEEGRGIFDNLTKFIVWTLPTNLGEGAIILVAILFGLTLPVLPVQVLWVNMTTALLLGLMLVFEPKEKGLMGRPPRDPARPLLTVPLIMRTAIMTVFIVGAGLWFFERQLIHTGGDLGAARTVAINTIVMVEIAYLFSCRSLSRSLLSVGLFTNPAAFAGVAAMILLQIFFTYSPAMNRLFGSVPIGFDQWAGTMAVAAVSFIAVEIEKWFRLRRRHQPAALAGGPPV